MEDSKGPSVSDNSRALCGFEEDAQDGHGVERPARTAAEVVGCLAVRSRALCGFEEDAQDGHGVKRPARTAEVVRCLAVRAVPFADLKKTRKTGTVSSAPPERRRKSFVVWRCAAVPFADLKKTRKTGTVSSAPPEWRRKSFVVWRRAAVPFALMRQSKSFFEKRLGREPHDFAVYCYTIFVWFHTVRSCGQGGSNFGENPVTVPMGDRLAR